MKKALALALVASFALASTVSAFTGESLLNAPSAGKSNTYYNPITSSKDFQADAVAAQNAIKAVEADASKWGDLLVLFCNHAQKLEDFQKELANKDALIALANSIQPNKEVGKAGDIFKGGRGEGKIGFYTPEMEAVAKSAPGTAVGPDTLFGKYISAEEADKLIAKWSDLEYQKELNEVRQNYGSTHNANVYVTALQSLIVEYNGILKVIAEFADKNGLSLKDAKCAVPAGIIDVKTEKKDVVPNTGAAK